MTEKKKTTTTGGRGIFKSAIGYIYQQTVLKPVRVYPFKMASEKVANTVGTF